MLSTMLRAGITLGTNCCPEMIAMTTMLHSAFSEGQGVIGFGKLSRHNMFIRLFNASLVDSTWIAS
jgi:hypothetical protein